MRFQLQKEGLSDQNKEAKALDTFYMLSFSKKACLVLGKNKNIMKKQCASISY